MTPVCFVLWSLSLNGQWEGKRVGEGVRGGTSRGVHVGSDGLYL